MEKNYFSKALFTLCAFLMILPALNAQLPDRVLVGYWHNWEALRLTDVNDRYNVLMLSFLEADKDGSKDNNVVGDLEFTPYNASQLKADIPTVQAQGKKVIISIGGANGSFKLNNSTDVNTFVSKVKSFITEYGVDGIDIDLERTVYMCSPSGSLSSPATYMQNVIDGVEQLLSWYQSTYGRKMILTTAPEVSYTTGGISPWNACNGSFLPFIEQLRNDIDLLMIQLYNSGNVYSIKYPGNKTEYAAGTVDFIITQTEAAIEGFTINNSAISGSYSGLPASKIAVALPACSGAGSGYVSPTNVKAAMEYLMGCGSKPGSYTLSKTYPELRGLMTWSINNDANASCSGSYTFADAYTSISCPVVINTKEIIANAQLKLSPNPATNSVLIEGIIDNLVQVFDLNGNLLVSAPTNNTQYALNTSGLANGIYLVQSGTTVTKLVVQRD